MSYPDYRTAPGFGQRSQQPIEEIPTDTEGFLRWGTTLDPDHPFKYELSNGKVSRTMINVSKAHWRVTANILRELFEKADPARYEVGPTELGVRTGVGVRYPDIVVDRASYRAEGLACEAPAFLVEILSPSTKGLDFTTKLGEYAAISSVNAYLICSPDEPRAWVWQRGTDGEWPELPVEVVERDGAIDIRELGIQLSMANIFRGIPDAPTSG